MATNITCAFGTWAQSAVPGLLIGRTITVTSYTAGMDTPLIQNPILQDWDYFEFNQKRIKTDDGSEFVNKGLDKWINEKNVELFFFRSGKSLKKEASTKHLCL